VKVGILAHDFISWSGGVDFLGTVIDSLLTGPAAGRAEFHLLLPESGKSAWPLGLPKLWRRNASEAALPEAWLERAGGLAIHRIKKGRPALVREVKQNKLDAVLPAVHSLRADFPRPWVGYAYDFQHKYFPEHFPPENRRSRDEHFTDMLTTARAVIVNSRAVAADIARFVPEATARVFALPFAPAPQGAWGEERPEILPRYGLAPPYFLISNQFWMHKDHATAFEAFRLIAEENPAVCLVCTGSTKDERNRAFFPQLMEKVRAWGLERRIRVLGLVPKRDQIEIMKEASAVLQPTLFEGGPGGGAIYDAASLGVPAIVSDLPVNREIEGAEVEFFPAGDAKELARQMRKRFAAARVRRPWEELLAAGQRRRAACGAVLWSAINAAAGAPADESAA
jgi:glycosyltransferase involved in cell wall biosynthesis